MKDGRKFGMDEHSFVEAKEHRLAVGITVRRHSKGPFSNENLAFTYVRTTEWVSKNRQRFYRKLIKISKISRNSISRENV